MGTLSAPTELRTTMKSLILVLLLGCCVLLTTQARRVKRLHGQSKHLLEKEESNKIYHGPAYKKALTDEEFAQKKARYYKKLRLGHRGEHRPANTRHDQDDLSLQDLSVQQDKPSPSPSTVKHKKINYNKVMKLKSLKPSKKMEKMYKKLLAKEKLRMKKKH